MLPLKKKEKSYDNAAGGVLSRIKAGDESAFSEIVALLQKKIFRIAYGYVMNSEDAMEIVQDTFFKVYQSVGSLRDDSKLESWILRIAINLSIDKYRKNKRTGKYFIATTDGDEIENRPGIETKTTLYDLSEHSSVKRAISNLPHKQKIIIIMRYFEGLKVDTIAEILGITPGAVKKLHFNAIRKLRESASVSMEE